MERGTTKFSLRHSKGSPGANNQGRDHREDSRDTERLAERIALDHLGPGFAWVDGKLVGPSDRRKDRG